MANWPAPCYVVSAVDEDVVLARADDADIAFLAVEGWGEGAHDALEDWLSSASPAVREEHLSQFVRGGDAPRRVLAKLGMGGWAGTTAAAAAAAAYCEAYAEMTRLALPAIPRSLAGARYLPGQLVTGPGDSAYVLDGGSAAGGSPLVTRPGGPKGLFHRAAVRGPLVLEFASEEAARTALADAVTWGRPGPIADGDVLAVRGAGTWLACGPEMVPAAVIPDGSGRYTASIRLARAISQDSPHLELTSETKASFPRFNPPETQAHLATLDGSAARIGFPADSPFGGPGPVGDAEHRSPARKGQAPRAVKPPTA